MSEFLFKPFAEMTPEDYAAVGFKSGLEIHQQLLTEKKLFCRCPAGRYSDSLRRRDPPPHAPDAVRARRVRRHGPDGVQDQERDHLPDQPRDGLHLRDGRHAAVHDRRAGPGHRPGHRHALQPQPGRRAPHRPQAVPRRQHPDRLPADDDRRRRRLDPLQGPPHPASSSSASKRTPAARSATSATAAPTSPTGWACRSSRPSPAPTCARPRRSPKSPRSCRRLVRSTGRVRTGIGAAREDVNVSVRGGTRVEIKGVPRIPRIPLLTYNEAMRQWNLLRLRDELGRRGITAETFKAETEDVTKLLRRTSYQPIRNALDAGARRRAPSSCAASAACSTGRPRPTPISPGRSPTASGSSPA